MTDSEPPEPSGTRKGHAPVERTPQDKKRLSYAKDRRNSYGENAKASRKWIPLRKAMENRDNRRKAKQLSAGIERLDEAEADLAQNSLTSGVERVGGCRKAADTPLGVCVANRKAAVDFRRRLNRRKRGLPVEDGT